MKKIFACIVLLHSPLWAAEKNSQAANGTTKAEEKSTTIYFQPPPSQNIYVVAPNLSFGKKSQEANKYSLDNFKALLESIKGTPAQNHSKETSIEVEVSKVIELIERVKEDMCKANPHGTYEISLGGSVGGGVVITAEANGGIKAIIPCALEKETK